ncbi:MAG TPA: TrkA family potassium uptake protein [Desulfurococcales archaeon]|nr:TrkA family potassium uptake protein [Desulfurococcales archaeon]
MRILIIGAGETGRHTAKLLSKKGNEIIVVDKDRAKCEMVANEADVMAIIRDATDPGLYEEIDLRRIDVVVASTDRDEVNLFIAMIAKDYGVPRVVVRVKDEKIAKLLERVGVEAAICVPYVTAKLIESLIEGKYSVVELVPSFTGNYGLVSLTLTENDYCIGKHLSNIKLPKECKIIAVFDGERFLDPKEVTDLRPGYEIVALVRKDKIEEFKQAFR